MTLALLAETALPYTRPFIQPLPVWDYWWAMLFPLVAAICIVYKGVKVSHIGELPRAAATMAAWVILAFVAAAVGIYFLVKLLR